VGIYPVDNPTIHPMLAYSLPASTFSIWSSFSETATKNGGEIYYQLSDDGGNTWRYWDGGNWSTAGGSNYNTATDVNTNIFNFPTSSASIMFKAFLSSDGTQQVQLDNVRVGWGETVGTGGYATFGYLISSAFNMRDSSPVQILSWDEDNSDCGICEVKLQLRVAPDSGGSPGIWSSWYGLGGIGVYYIDPDEQILSTDLNWRQWVQYRVELSGDGSFTPILREVRVNYK